jgi:hypothetical protein
MSVKRTAFGVTAVLLLGVLAQTQTFTTLYNFTGGSDGGWPSAAVTQGPAGDLYGTAYVGGNQNSNHCVDEGCGVVCELNTSGTESVLYSFCSQTDCVDGALPVTPMVRDSAGNIYGTTSVAEALPMRATFSESTPQVMRRCCTASAAARTAAAHGKA